MGAIFLETSIKISLSDPKSRFFQTNLVLYDFMFIYNNIYYSKKANMKIRKYSSKDLPDIVKINVDCRKHNYKWNVDQKYLDSISYERQLKKRKNKKIKWNIFVAEIDSEIAWFIHWWKSRDWEGFPPYEIRWLYVDPKHQWKWIWTKLFKFLVDLVWIKSFYLWTLKNNPQSEWFYQKMWWVKFEEKTKEFWWYPIKEVWYKWE